MFYVLSSPSPIKTFENKLRRDPAILNLMRTVDPLVKPEDDKQRITPLCHISTNEVFAQAQGESGVGVYLMRR